MTSELNVRRVDLDWLRIGAFALLILYHVGMFYVGWDWHVNSSRPIEGLAPVMQFFSPWRLGLLFLISGCATAFMLRKMSPGALAGSRVKRLLPPLILGIFVIVPPQSYYEVVEKIAWSEGPLSFYKLYLTGYDGFCRDGSCLVVPIYNHLWFVAYLLIYVLLLAALLRMDKSLIERLRQVSERHLSGWGILLWPWLILALCRWTLGAYFPPTNYLVDDWYNHALYFSLFAIGVVLARCDQPWADLVRHRWLTLVLGIAASAATAFYLDHYQQLGTHPPLWQRFTMRGVTALQQWMMIAAALGWGHMLLRRDGPVRRYLTDAIFPYYIAHQTIIVVAAFYLPRLGLPVGLEAALLLAITLLGCAATYELVRRVGWLRPWFGLKREETRKISDPLPAV